MNNLYMFAIMPPKPLGDRIHTERIAFSENYNCIKALKPPVHITIYEPFTQGDDFEDKVAGLQKWADAQSLFTVKLDNFGFFENPGKPVFMIKVVKDANITSLRTDLLRELKKYVEEPDEEYLANGKPIPKSKPMPFNPHFTIGYRDVPEEIVPAIKQAYARRRFDDSFMCDAIYLWYHNGQNWEVNKTFKLSGKKEQLSLF